MNTEIFTPEEAKHHHHVQSLLDEMTELPLDGTHIDFGCGDGWYVDRMNAAGFDSFGVEGSRIPNTLSNPDRFLQWDLRYPLWLSLRGFVSCIEVMEHIHHEHHDTVMDTLSRHCAGTLLLTWAVPGQGGTRHVSERTQEQVVPYVAQWGLSFNEAESMRMRERVGAECGYMKNTIYLFQR